MWLCSIIQLQLVSTSQSVAHSSTINMVTSRHASRILQDDSDSHRRIVSGHCQPNHATPASTCLGAPSGIRPGPGILSDRLHVTHSGRRWAAAVLWKLCYGIISGRTNCTATRANRWGRRPVNTQYSQDSTGSLTCCKAES